MPFCRNCGTEVSPQAKFCPNCAAPQFEGVEETRSTATPLKEEGKPKGPPRPRWPLVLSLVQFAVGGVLVVVGFIGLLAFSWLGAVFVALGVVSVAGGFTTWKANPAAFKAVLVTGIGYLAIGILLALANQASSVALGALGILFGAYLVFWIRGKSGKRYIRQI